MTYQSQQFYSPEQEQSPESIIRNRKAELYAGIAEIREARRTKPMPEVLVPASQPVQFPEHQAEVARVTADRFRTEEELRLEQIRAQVAQESGNPLVANRMYN